MLERNDATLKIELFSACKHVTIDTEEIEYRNGGLNFCKGTRIVFLRTQTRVPSRVKRNDLPSFCRGLRQDATIEDVTFRETFYNVR